jgi:hypothetical protein
VDLLQAVVVPALGRSKSGAMERFFHTTIDVTWMLFPVRGSYYDPRVAGLIMTFVAAMVEAMWGPRTLARYR